MSINFNIPLKAQRKSSPLKPLHTNLDKKHTLPLKTTEIAEAQTTPLDQSAIDK